MRISELAQRSQLPLATVKYYLREGLLHEGVRTSATQARYDEGHLARLRLVRSLLGPGGLSVARARDVLAALDDPPPNPLDVLEVAVSSVRRPVETAPHDEVHDLMKRWGWPVHTADCPEHQVLADALGGLEAAGFAPPEGVLDAYARAMDEVAAAEIAHVPDDPVEAVSYVVLGVVLNEPVLLAMRRLAESAEAQRRFLPPDTPASPAAATPGTAPPE